MLKGLLWGWIWGWLTRLFIGCSLLGPWIRRCLDRALGTRGYNLRHRYHRWLTVLKIKDFTCKEYILHDHLNPGALIEPASNHMMAQKENLLVPLVSEIVLNYFIVTYARTAHPCHVVIPAVCVLVPDGDNQAQVSLYDF